MPTPGVNIGSSDWRRLYRNGALGALRRPRGRLAPNPLAADNERLRCANAKLARRLATAERIIEIQRNISELLGIPLDPESDDDKSGS